MTTDGGNTWEYKSLGGFGYPVDVGFRTATEGWMPISYIRKFFFTSDFGNNWTEIDTPDSAMISHICFTDSAHGFGIGPYGTIVKYVYQEPSNLTEPEHSYSNFNLQQNYPNPFNPSTTIKYSIADEGFVKLVIFNMLGEEVATLVNTQQKAGKYEVNFTAKGGSASGGNAYNLSSGVYFYKLRAGSFYQIRKMILMK